MPGPDGEITAEQVKDMNVIYDALFCYSDKDGNRLPIKGLPADTKSFITALGINFADTENVFDFGSSNVVTNVPLNPLTAKQTKELMDLNNKDAVYLHANLVFIASPCTSTSRSDTGFQSMTRTCNAKAAEDEEFRFECVKEAIRADYDAAIANGCTVYFPSQTGCGIYVPDKAAKEALKPHGKLDNDLFLDLHNEVLDEVVGPNGETRRQYFKEIIMVE